MRKVVCLVVFLLSFSSSAEAQVSPEMERQRSFSNEVMRLLMTPIPAPPVLLERGPQNDNERRALALLKVHIGGGMWTSSCPSLSSPEALLDHVVALMDVDDVSSMGGEAKVRASLEGDARRQHDHLLRRLKEDYHEGVFYGRALSAIEACGEVLTGGRVVEVGEGARRSWGRLGALCEGVVEFETVEVVVEGGGKRAKVSLNGVVGLPGGGWVLSQGIDCRVEE